MSWKCDPMVLNSGDRHLSLLCSRSSRICKPGASADYECLAELRDTVTQLKISEFVTSDTSSIRLSSILLVLGVLGSQKPIQLDVVAVLACLVGLLVLQSGILRTQTPIVIHRYLRICTHPWTFARTIGTATPIIPWWCFEYLGIACPRSTKL